MFDLFSKRKKRAEDLERLSFALEMKYQPTDEFGLINLLKDFKLFKKGHSRKITNILEKTGDELGEATVQIFDYKYVIQANNTPVVFNQTVFFIQSKQLDLPQFLMRPENFFQRIGVFLGMQDINFESHPDFSSQYLLQGPEEELIRNSLNEDFRNFFTIEKNWSLEGLNYFLIFYAKKKLLTPEAITDFYQKGLKIYQLLLTT